jgi:uncharacterized membrane protein YGL010W
MKITLFDKIFRSANGEIVIGQIPNLPITIWFLATILKIFVKTEKINIGLDVLAAVSLFVWAIGELFQGVNYFRRGLGLLVLVWLVASKIQ